MALGDRDILANLRQEHGAKFLKAACYTANPMDIDQTLAVALKPDPKGEQVVL